MNRLKQIQKPALASEPFLGSILSLLFFLIRLLFRGLGTRTLAE